VLAAVLAPGYYAGHWGIGARRRRRPTAFLAQLEIELETQDRRVVVTAPTWRGRAGPWIEADLLHGERYDAGAEVPGWDAPGARESGWSAVEVRSFADAPLC